MSFYDKEQTMGAGSVRRRVTERCVAIIAAFALAMGGAVYAAADNDSGQDQSAAEASQATQNSDTQSGDGQDDSGQADAAQGDTPKTDQDESESADAAASDDSQDKSGNEDAATGSDTESQSDSEMTASNASEQSSGDIVKEQVSSTLLASDIIGMPVKNGTGEDAEKIGDITDLVLDEDQHAITVLIGVGGFLGIGQKQVGVSLDDVEFGSEGEPAVVDMSSEELQDAPAYKSLADQKQEQQQMQQQQAPATGGGMGGQ